MPHRIIPATYMIARQGDEDGRPCVTIASAERWIECECPYFGMDWDEFTIVGPDTTLHCTGCDSLKR